MTKYLYGAAVQGIQGFIFQTSKLREIVGASELVEEICTTKFLKIAGIKDKDKDKDKDDPNIILNAAGNIKYIFEDETKCRNFVRIFPKIISETAPGITISQAVVKYEEGSLNDSLQELENKLRVQRNKLPVPFEVGFMGTERSRRTSGVAYIQNPLPNENELIDEATSKKLAKRDSKKQFENISGLTAFETKELLFNTDDLKGSWMAVIHADGNGLGAIIQSLNQSLKGKSDEEVKNAFRTFSKALDDSTKEAAKKAFEEVNIKKDKNVYPIRPVVLGGDDLTVIIRADLALNFTTEFLKAFEEKSKEKLSFLKNNFGIEGFGNGITACAGIAYVKKSYPFHYAVNLSEKLCADAKNFVKGKGEYENNHPEMNGLIPKSSLAFFKVQDSFIERSLSEMKERTLKSKNIDFRYGPYLIHNNTSFANIEELRDKLKVVEDFNSKDTKKGESNGVSKLRQWITEVYKDKTTADFMLDRMKVINSDFYGKMKIDEDKKKEKSILFDVIQLNSFKN